jgi:hypothetical protein
VIRFTRSVYVNITIAFRCVCDIIQKLHHRERTNNNPLRYAFPLLVCIWNGDYRT